MTDLQAREPSLFQSLVPLVLLATLLGTAVYLFGDNASYGANQVALMLAAGVAVGAWHCARQPQVRRSEMPSTWS